MRSSFVSLTCAAGALVALMSGTAVRHAGASCCDADEDSKAAEVAAAATPDAAGPKAEAVKTEAAKAEATSPKPLPVPTPLDEPPKELADVVAYADVFGMLSYENSCSDFFGGPRLALTALNGLATQLRSRALGAGALAIRMQGGYTIYRSTATGETYRLFEDAVVNSDGPFGIPLARSRTARMLFGRFHADTRQARALILLHELGHLVATPSGEWVLPDDGDDRRRSGRNTQAVESRCLRQLLAIKV